MDPTGNSTAAPVDANGFLVLLTLRESRTSTQTTNAPDPRALSDAENGRVTPEVPCTQALGRVQAA